MIINDYENPHFLDIINEQAIINVSYEGNLAYYCIVDSEMNIKTEISLMYGTCKIMQL